MTEKQSTPEEQVRLVQAREEARARLGVEEEPRAPRLDELDQRKLERLRKEMPRGAGEGVGQPYISFPFRKPEEKAGGKQAERKPVTRVVPLVKKTPEEIGTEKAGKQKTGEAEPQEMVPLKVAETLSTEGEGHTATPRPEPVPTEKEKRRLTELAKEVKDKRIKGEAPYEWDRIRALLEVRGITPDTEEAAAFMDRWDKEEARRLLSEETPPPSSGETFPPAEKKTIDELLKNLEVKRWVYGITYRELKAKHKQSLIGRAKGLIPGLRRRPSLERAVREALATHDGKRSTSIVDALVARGFTQEEAQEIQSLESLKIAYDHAKRRYGETLYNQKRRELTESGKSQEEWTHELAQFQGTELFQKLIIEERERLHELVAEGLPSPDRGRLAKALAWYAKQNIGVRLAVSTAMVTGAIAVTGGFTAGVGSAALFAANRFVRGGIALASGQAFGEGVRGFFRRRAGQGTEKQLVELRSSLSEMQAEEYLQGLNDIDTRYGDILEEKLKKEGRAALYGLLTKVAIGAGVSYGFIKLAHGLPAQANLEAPPEPEKVAVPPPSAHAAETTLPTTTPPASELVGTLTPEGAEAPVPPTSLPAEVAPGPPSTIPPEDALTVEKPAIVPPPPETVAQVAPEGEFHSPLPAEQLEAATIKQGEGAYNAIYRQYEMRIRGNPESFKLTQEDLANTEKVKELADHKTMESLIKEKYFNPETGEELRIKSPGTHVILQDDGSIKPLKEGAVYKWRPIPAEIEEKVGHQPPPDTTLEKLPAQEPTEAPTAATRPRWVHPPEWAEQPAPAGEVPHQPPAETIQSASAEAPPKTAAGTLAPESTAEQPPTAAPEGGNFIAEQRTIAIPEDLSPTPQESAIIKAAGLADSRYSIIQFASVNNYLHAFPLPDGQTISDADAIEFVGKRMHITEQLHGTIRSVPITKAHVALAQAMDAIAHAEGLTTDQLATKSVGEFLQQYEGKLSETLQKIKSAPV